MELLNWKLLIACFLLGGCLTAFIMLLFFENEHLKKISLSKTIDFTLSWLSRLWYPFGTNNAEQLERMMARKEDKEHE